MNPLFQQSAARGSPVKTTRKSRKVVPLACFCLLVGTSTLAAAPTATEHTFVHKPDALLQIDLSRPSVIEKIVDSWKGEIPAAQISSFRSKLSGLRADQLLAANVSGSFDTVLAIVHHHESSLSLLSNAIQASTVQIPTVDLAKAAGDSAGDLVYTPIAPCRIVDTRSATGSSIPNPMQGNVAYAIKTHSSTGFTSLGGSVSDCGIPATGDVRAVVVNVSVLQQPGLPNFSAYLAISESNVVATLLSNSTINFNANQAAGSSVVVKTNSAGVVYMGLPSSVRTNVVLEVTGYFMPPNRDGNGLRVINNNTTAPTVVNGAAGNIASASGSTIAGGGITSAITACHDQPAGGTRTCANITDAADSTIGGGFAHEMSSVANSATIAGGQGNTIKAAGGAIGGGFENSVYGGNSAIAGGFRNFAGGNASTVAGGSSNRALGAASTVPGGRGNFADADDSFAAGRRAKATATGQFVWADGTDLDFNPAANLSFGGVVANTFSVRARGGVEFASAVNLATGDVTAGCYISSGGTGWNCASDQNAKYSIDRVSVSDVLDKLMSIPISTWSMNETTVKQMGPMAQDFYNVFSLGLSDRSINSVDAQGVAFAAIQGLNHKISAEAAKSKAKDVKIKALEDKVAEIGVLKSQLVSLKKRLGL
jgi:hypothetical protein